MDVLHFVSEKRGGRIYTRSFDHDKARELYATGDWTYERLAERFGVSSTAVARVVSPRARARMDRQTRKNARAKRRPCRGGCGRLVWRDKKRSGFCTACVAALKVAADVRPSELRCTRCREWKPDDQFHRSGKGKPAKARRGRRPFCKSCDHKARTAYRDLNREKDNEYNRDRYRTGKKGSRKEGSDSMAQFIVFRPNGEGFVEQDRVEAASAAHAVEKVAKEPGEYVAVPAGRFKLMRVGPISRLGVIEEVNPDD